MRHTLQPVGIDEGSNLNTKTPSGTLTVRPDHPGSSVPVFHLDEEILEAPTTPDYL